MTDSRSLVTARPKHGVRLVKKYHTRGQFSGQTEKCSNVLLTFTNIHIIQICSADLEHCGARFFGHGFGGESLACSWRTVEHETRDLVGSKYTILESIRSGQRQSSQCLESIDCFNWHVHIVEGCL